LKILKRLPQKIQFAIFLHLQHFIRGDFIEGILLARVLDCLNYQNLIIVLQDVLIVILGVIFYH